MRTFDWITRGTRNEGRLERSRQHRATRRDRGLTSAAPSDVINSMASLPSLMRIIIFVCPGSGSLARQIHVINYVVAGILATKLNLLSPDYLVYKQKYFYRSFVL